MYSAIFFLLLVALSHQSLPRVKRQDEYIIHRKYEERKGGTIATISGRGPPPLSLFPLPGIFWNPPPINNNHTHTISSWHSGANV